MTEKTVLIEPFGTITKTETRNDNYTLHDIVAETLTQINTVFDLHTIDTFITGVDTAFTTTLQNVLHTTYSDYNITVCNTPLPVDDYVTNAVTGDYSTKKEASTTVLWRRVKEEIKTRIKNHVTENTDTQTIDYFVAVGDSTQDGTDLVTYATQHNTPTFDINIDEYLNTTPVTQYNEYTNTSRTPPKLHTSKTNTLLTTTNSTKHTQPRVIFDSDIPTNVLHDVEAHLDAAGIRFEHNWDNNHRVWIGLEEIDTYTITPSENSLFGGTLQIHHGNATQFKRAENTVFNNGFTFDVGAGISSQNQIHVQNTYNELHRDWELDWSFTSGIVEFPTGT